MPSPTQILDFDDKGFHRGMKAFQRRLLQISDGLRGSAPNIQNIAAEIIADLYKAFLREGVGDSLTPFTKALHDLGDHPPLSTLADHVIVEPAKATKVRPHTRSSGTVSVRGYVRTRPASITFESVGGKDWSQIAVMHDRGYAVQVSNKVRRALLAMLVLKYGSLKNILDDDFGTTQGIWLVPARPHLKFFDKSSLDDELLKVAQSVIAGKVPNLKTDRPSRVEYRPDTKLRLDTVRL